MSTRCTAPLSSGNQRARARAHVPGGDPISTSGGGYAYPRVLTQNTIGTGLLTAKAPPLVVLENPAHRRAALIPTRVQYRPPNA